MKNRLHHHGEGSLHATKHRNDLECLNSGREKGPDFMRHLERKVPTEDALGFLTHGGDNRIYFIGVHMS